MSTNVPVPVFGPNGFILPQESAILNGVLADFQNAFGGDLNPALETPQGQLASSMAAIIGNAYATFLYYTQQNDPAYASGRMQDGIGRIYFTTRIPAQQTLVQATCSGAVGVVIPAGALAQATDGNLYTCAQAGTIPAGGSIVLPFLCNAFGPIACPEASLTTIYQAIPGWDQITNMAEGVIGNDTESRSAFEQRRALSVANNARGSLQSVLGTVLAIPGVLDAFAIDNPGGAPLVVGDYTLAPHSLFVSVVGGDNTAIATAIWSKKAPGCDYNGNTTVAIQDTQSGYNPPYPSYNVTFERPTALPILFNITILNTPQVPSNATALIQNAIINAFAGGDGGTRARIGSTLYASRYFAPIIALGTWAQEIINLLIGSHNTPNAVFTGSVAAGVLTVSAMTSGSIGVGDTIDDATGNLADGTTIVHQISGTPGLTGTYSVSISQAVGSETMNSASASHTTQVVNIDQVPTIAVPNINVVFQ